VYDEESRFTMDSPEISADLIKASDFSKRAESAIKDILDPSVSIREKEEMRCAIYANRFKIAHFRGRTENSLEYFARGERLMMENKFSERLSSLYASRSFLEHKAGNLESALSYIENAIKITSGSSKDLVLRDKALILLDLRSFNKAQLLCIEAYKSVPKASREVFKALLQSVTKILNILDTESQCEVEKLERLGDECSKVDAFRAAIWYYDNAVTRWKAGPQNDYKRLSGLLTSLAMTYKDLKMFDIASEYYQKELRISQTYPEEAFKTLMALCVTSDLGEKPLDVLKPLYTEAWKLTKDLKDERKEMHCLKEFIDFYDRRGENDGFLEQLRESLSSLLSDNGMSIEDIGPEVEESRENSDLEEFDVDELIYRMDASDKRSKRKVNLKKDMKGETELHRKVKTPGHKREVARLIETCVFVDLEDNANYTPLHEASNHGQLEYVEMLIAAGADVNKVSESGTSPLISAAVNGHMDVMEYLLDQGAKPYHQDSDGWSALDYFKDADLSNNKIWRKKSRAKE
ncbi:Tonsokulike proteinlike, partial [Caligus rogercresseyi]